MSVSFKLFLGFLLFAFLGTGCGGSKQSPELGGWTLDAESLTLTEEMTTSGTENYFFGDIGDLAVTSDGRLIVADTDAQHLKVLRPDGTLIDTVGRGGQGPGEFQGMGSVFVDDHDSMYVMDSDADRLSVFAPESPYEFHGIVSASKESGASRFLVLGTRYAAMVTGGFSPDSDERPPPNTWHALRPDGTLGDTLLTARRPNRKMMQVDGGFVIGTVPFTRRTIVTTGPDDRVYSAWTDRLRVEATTLDGTSEVVASIPAPPVPITGAERDSALAQFGNSELRTEMASDMPDAKPALTGMLVADDGRIWVERPTQGVDPDSTTWWRLLPDEKTIEAVTLPVEVSLEAVRNGTAYAKIEPEEAAPAVVRYDVRIER